MGFLHRQCLQGNLCRLLKTCIEQCRRLKLVRLYKRTHTLIRQHFQQ